MMKLLLLSLLMLQTAYSFHGYKQIPSFQNSKLMMKSSSSPLDLIQKFTKASLLYGLISCVSLSNVNAFGPVEIPLKIISYKQVDLCNGKKPTMPGQKAMEGLFPVCIEVSAKATSSSDKQLKDVSIYGFVKENNAGNSVLPNNPDFKSDAGQYAMIKSVSPGESEIMYQFVAAISGDPKEEALPELTFMKTKAVSYPGGDKFKPLDECEIDPRAQGCNDGMYDE